MSRWSRESTSARPSLRRGTDFRSGQLWLYGARTALELAVLVAAVRLAPRDRRRPVLTGAATAVAITLTTTVVALPVRAASRERAKRVGLVTQSWGGWAVDVGKGTAIGGVMAGAGGALLVVGMRRFGRDWWAPGAAVVAGFALVFTYLGPVVLDPGLQHGSRRCPRAQTRVGRARRWRARRASTSARSTRSTPRGARRRPTPTSPGSAAPSASCSTTRC